MIVWLASYPRSGNTLLRIILRQCFGQFSYSIYNDRTDIAENAALSELVGHRVMNAPAKQFVLRRSSSPELTFLKTHGGPTDRSRAIYIVRDGRAAIISYKKYLKNVRNRNDVSMADVIRGSIGPFGSWSDHIEAWAPATRPETLILKFEELIEDVTTAISGISTFIGLAPIAEWQLGFESLQRIYPEFFSAGSNAKVTELSEEDEALFMDLHGQTMRAMGYMSTNF